ncbi:lysophospholipid acyltransferase family protein [Rubricoccus marinus]|uniref:Phospholipid/glycerol acyltransferase domain-containing protein n=1 Tax=Rubricoccus marinus TaxID=716817 RepID=A0A259U2I6_9BACT|nr:lysophospholipid acyltransferase family protein [Rubricoccus marinus]OZC04181.1 hypothetical protein BSZ36_15040 [Rubricoccus marinus]
MSFSTPPRSLASRLWFAWTMLVYVLFTPPYWVPWMLAMRLRPTARTFWRWFRGWDHVVFTLCGFRLRTVREGASGAEVGPAVYVANHQAMLDIPALILAMDAPFVFVARGSLRRVPLVAGILRQSRCVFLDRTASGTERALDESAERLGAGESVLFFPEGTRSFDGRLKSFYPSAFRLAIRAGVPIVPVALGGTHQLLDEKARTARPGLVHVRIGAPLHALPDENAGSLSARAHAEVERLLALAAPEAVPAEASGA